MPYDESKNEVIISVGFDADNDTFIEISVVSYNGGEPKIQLSRYTMDGEERKYRKLGRLTFSEATKLCAALPPIVESNAPEAEPDDAPG